MGPTLSFFSFNSFARAQVEIMVDKSESNSDFLLFAFGPPEAKKEKKRKTVKNQKLREKVKKKKKRERK